MTNPELINQDTAELATLLIKSLLSCYIVYGSILLGLELGGRSQGYPGRGIEMHEELMKMLFKKKD